MADQTKQCTLGDAVEQRCVEERYTGSYVDKTCPIAVSSTKDNSLFV